MREQLLVWLASLRVRLIVTYVLVTAISFAFFNLVLMKTVERYLLAREENNLKWTAHTLGTTIRTPWRDNAAWQEDQFWTQRRSCDVASVVGARIRLLSAEGRVLTDTVWGHCNSDDWQGLRNVRGRAPVLRDLPEVRTATLGLYTRALRRDGETPRRPSTLFIAKPILRQDNQIGGQRVAFIMYMSKPVDAALQDLRGLRRAFMVGMVATLLITVLVSILVSSNLAAGMRSAMRVAQAFAAGRMDQRMRETGRDELGQLGAAVNKMADALQRQEQLRRDLLADVSHELRTPLTAISGCADTLADGALRDDPAAAERFLGIIVRESQRLQRLVSDILELSKLQAGVITIPRRPLPMHALVRDAVEVARLHGRQEAVTIHCAEALHDDTLLVMGNEDRLAQALRNLLDNARHHTPAGKSVTVSCDTTPDCLSVHIRDEGEGIPPEDLPSVFDRFYRAGKGGKSGGTGLGLAIVREIIQAHEGRVTVESTLGVGTTFSLHLPRVQAEPMVTADADA